MAYRIYVTSNEIPRSALDILKSAGTVIVNSKEGPPPRKALLKEAAVSDAILCLLTERIDGPLMARAKHLKIVSNMAVGLDNIEINEATRRNILVTNTPGVLTETVADFTVALILAVARRIVEADRYARGGRWTIRWTPMMMVGSDLHGKTVGIYGLGRIGLAVAKRLKGFETRILYFDSVRNGRAEKEQGLIYVTPEELLRESDFVTVHVPLLPGTRHCIGPKQFAMMKKTAFLINTSRGPVVDEKALYSALVKRQIAGAGLDVFEEEPIGPKNPLKRLDNVILLPHIASASIETRTRMAEMAAQSIAEALKGEIPSLLVNKDVLKNRAASEVCKEYALETAADRSLSQKGLRLGVDFDHR